MDAKSPQRHVPQHDFMAKLLDPEILPRISAIVEWQRAVRAAQAAGAPEPPMPQVWPVSINLDLTTACNYHCPHCVDLLQLNGKVKHGYDDLVSATRFLAEKGLKSAILIGGGEPTVYPRFGDMVGLLKELGIQVAIVSNGSGNAKIEKVAHLMRRPDWIRLSLDSATEETFQAMHLPKRGVTLGGICEGIAGIREKNPDIDVGFSFIITWEGAVGVAKDKIVPNIGEIVAAARRARDSGFTYISFKPFLDRFESGSEGVNEAGMEDYDKTMERIRDAIAEARVLERPGFEVREATNLSLLESGRADSMRNQPHTCYMQPLRLVWSPDGIINCPANRSKKHAVIADKNGFASEGFQSSLADMVKNFDAHAECKEVTCLYNSANWAIEDMVEGKRATAPSPGTKDYFL